MPINLELKIKLDNPGNIYKRIELIKAEYISEFQQVDVYYKNEKFRLKLRLENGSQTLIKYLRNEKEGERWSHYELISLAGNDVRKYLADILDEDVVVEKIRRFYMYDNTRIHIDNVKYLGFFLELETLVINGKEDAIKRYNKVVNLLTLENEIEIKKSYMDLMRERR